MTEKELYAEQMKHWFNEHERIGNQIARAVKHHEDIAQCNRDQLTLHNKRMDLAIGEYNEWARENELPERHIGKVEQETQIIEAGLDKNDRTIIRNALNDRLILVKKAHGYEDENNYVECIERLMLRFK